MRMKILLIILLLMLSLSRCTTEKAIGGVHVQEKHDVLDIRIDFVKKVRVEQGDKILTATFLFYDRAGNRIGAYGYTSPEKDLVINIFNRNLDLEKTKILKQGQGPGDVCERTFIFSYEDKIIAANNLLRRITIFDKDFHFIKSDRAIRQGRFIDNGDYFLSLSRIAEKKIRFDFSIFSYPGFNEKKIADFGPYNRNLRRDKKNRIILGVLPVFDYFYRNNTIFFVDLKNYIITTYSLAGKALKKIIVGHKTLKASEKMKKTWLKEWAPGKFAVRNVTFTDIVQPGAAVVPLGKGFVVLRRKDYSMICKGGLMEGDYFDYDLNLLGKVKVPCFYRAMGIIDKPVYTHHFEDGFLYLVTGGEDDGYVLEKWRIKE